ncbi:MAG: adenylyltransferase/cytidyltransferase family protein [Chitinophagaceae bacterium]
MQVHRDINNLPNFKNAVITIGTFDGVHTGHLQIIKQLKEEAEKINGESVIITFDPHPRMVITSR